LEATPGNFFNPKAARRIAAACPKAKLLIIVRCDIALVCRVCVSLPR
jgi:hypothetical protein